MPETKESTWSANTAGETVNAAQAKEEDNLGDDYVEEGDDLDEEEIDANYQPDEKPKAKEEKKEEKAPEDLKKKYEELEAKYKSQNETIVNWNKFLNDHPQLLELIKNPEAKPAKAKEKAQTAADDFEDMPEFTADELGDAKITFKKLGNYLKGKFSDSVINAAVAKVMEAIAPLENIIKEDKEKRISAETEKICNGFRADYKDTPHAELVEKCLTEGTEENKKLGKLIAEKGLTIDEAFKLGFHDELVRGETNSRVANRRNISISVPQGRPVKTSEPKRDLRQTVKDVIAGKLT